MHHFIRSTPSSKMSYNYMETLSNESLHRYKFKMQLIGLQKCPYKLPALAWTNDSKQWPEFRYPDLYHYLIKSPSKCPHINNFINTY